MYICLQLCKSDQSHILTLFFHLSRINNEVQRVYCCASLSFGPFTMHTVQAESLDENKKRHREKKVCSPQL